MKERSQRSNSYRSFIIRLLNSFILCYKIIEVERFPSTEDWMSAALIKRLSYLLHLAHFVCYVHSFGTLPFQIETVSLRILIQWNGSLHVWRQIVWKNKSNGTVPLTLDDRLSEKIDQL